ncbi:MAG: phosphatase PAP2 family protein [Gemmatimonadales bacterium]
MSGTRAHGAERVTTASFGLGVPRRSTRSVLRVVLVEHAPLLLLVGAYVAGVWFAEKALGISDPLGNVDLGNSLLVWALTVIGYVVVRLLWLRAQVRGPSGEWVRSATAWRDAWDEFRRRNLALERLLTVLLATGLTVLLLRTYASWKPLITTVVPFRTDAELMRLDQAIHLGHHPWRLLQPLLGHPAVTLPLDLLYAMWHPVNCAFVIWLAWSGRRSLRARFLLVYALAWILLGTVGATMLSSAGPCYYALVFPGADPYAPLLGYLHRLHSSHGVIAVTIQQNLWAYYSGGSVLPVNGISAMPSVHVAAAVLFALVGWQVGRAIGIGFTIYALVILTGSVHLGWHYAVDGYVSAAAVLLLWVASGPVLRRYFAAVRLRD